VRCPGRAGVPRREREPRVEPKLVLPCIVTTSSPASSTGAELEARLERSLRSARARETSYALCQLDVDQFKDHHDTCGHSAGDALLGQVGALLKTKIRWRDTLARLGGDEFSVLARELFARLCDAHAADQLRETIRSYKFVWEERTFRLSCSRRVCADHRRQRGHVAALLSAADRCLRGSQGGPGRSASTASRKTTST